MRRWSVTEAGILSVEHSALSAMASMQATLTMYGGMLLPYYLHEETGWSLDINELRSQTYKVPKSP